MYKVYHDPAYYLTVDYDRNNKYSDADGEFLIDDENIDGNIYLRADPECHKFEIIHYLKNENVDRNEVKSLWNDIKIRKVVDTEMMPYEYYFIIYNIFTFIKFDCKKDSITFTGGIYYFPIEDPDANYYDVVYLKIKQPNIFIETKYMKSART